MRLAFYMHPFSIAALLLGWLIDPSLGEDEMPDVAPGSSIVISDRFFSDTREDYRFIGNVDWEAGVLKLSPESAVVRIEALLPSVECEVHLWPKSDKRQNSNITRLSLLLGNGWELVIAIFRQEQQGKLFRQVAIWEINRGGAGDRTLEIAETAELRRLAPFTLPGEVERWLIKEL